MNFLRKDTDYAARALIETALAGKRFISSSRIAGKQKIPAAYLRRLLSRLISAGYLEAKEGAGGGVRLARDPRAITLAELLELFQGGIEVSKCLFRKKLCANRAVCPLRKRMKKIESRLALEFKNITLASLVRDVKAGTLK